MNDTAAFELSLRRMPPNRDAQRNDHQRTTEIRASSGLSQPETNAWSERGCELCAELLSSDSNYQVDPSGCASRIPTTLRAARPRPGLPGRLEAPYLSGRGGGKSRIDPPKGSVRVQFLGSDRRRGLNWQRLQSWYPITLPPRRAGTVRWCASRYKDQ